MLRVPRSLLWLAIVPLLLSSPACRQDKTAQLAKPSAADDTSSSADAAVERTAGDSESQANDSGPTHLLNNAVSTDEDTITEKSSRKGDDDSTLVQAAKTPTRTNDPAGAASTCYKGDQFICDVEVAIVKLTNAKRAGLPALTHDAQLAFVSRSWSKQQAAVANISHNGFPSSRAAEYQREFGKAVAISAENVAMTTYRDAGKAEDLAATLVEMWYGSEGHRRNMLGNYRRLGSGVFRSGNAVYATQIFSTAP